MEGRLRCPSGCARCRTPAGLLTPSPCNMQKKSLNFRSGSSSECGGERGIDSLRSPCGQRRRLRCPSGCARCRTPAGLLTPSPCNMQKKSLNFRSGSSSECGGERGIRTPDTLPYTHFPGVLLQPLGHLTTFISLTALGQRGGTIGSRLKTVKHYFFLLIYSLKL